MYFGKDHFSSWETGTQKEWLITNGIGGFASSTIIGANTRRYHGLLVAALKPPVMRHLIVSKLDESLEIGQKHYTLYSNLSGDYVSDGFKHQQSFVMEYIPTYYYHVQDVFIEKRVCMVYGQNKTVVVYNISGGQNDCILRLAPLVNFRDHHFTTSKNYLSFNEEAMPNGINLRPHCFDANIFLTIDDGKFLKYQNSFFCNMNYPIEDERGLFGFDDHYIPGIFEVSIPANCTKSITVTMGIGEMDCTCDGIKIIQAEKDRLDGIVKQAGYDNDFAQRLVTAADKFIVQRDSTDSKTIIAGYPWFTDWGRDTMIAFEGLTLVTKRFDDAKNILRTFNHYIKDGLVPNMFPDSGDTPLYNTADASLWYIHSVYMYLKHTGDYSFVQQEIFDGMERIIGAYKNGTDYNIKMDNDYLINAGNQNTQLTWMDAKVGDWVVTPRHGKAVEINALWYNALKVMEILCERLGKPSEKYCLLAQKVHDNFNKIFWNEDEQCLFDVITDNHCDSAIRPNQIYAVSLEFPVVTGDRARNIVYKIMRELYCGYGIRSLSPSDNAYAGIYEGDQYKRDGAYHQGTAWGFLTGAFITAYVKVHDYSEQGVQNAIKMLNFFHDHLNFGCIDCIAEIFDGDFPNKPRGCFAQAWSVAEVLRAYVDVMASLHNKF